MSSDLNNYLNFLFGADTGYIYTPTREPENGEWVQEFWQWPRQKDEVIRFIEAQGEVRDVYISPVLWKTPVLNRSQFKQSNVSWTEFDGNALNGEDSIYEPSLRVQSSDINNQHVYFKLDKPVTDALELEKINRIITYASSADPSAWDLTQILRPPTTHNFKYDSLPEVKVIYLGSEILPRSLFKNVKEPKQVVTEIKEVPDLMSVIAKYTWPHEDVAFFLKSDIPEGSRSSAMMRLGHVCAELGMTPEDAFAILFDADERWGKYRNRSDRVARLIEIINKAFITRPPKLSKLEIVTMRDLLNTDYEDQDWIIERILLPNSVSVIYSQPGVGKTRLSFDLATHLATDQETYLGWKLKPGQKVLFLSLEMNGVELQHFAKDMPITVEDDRLLIYAEGSPIDMDKSAGQEMIYNIVRTLRPDVIIIDSLGAAVSTDVSRNEEVKQFFRFVNLLRREFGVALWLIHHGRKATNENKAPNSLSDLYGSVYIGAEATTVFCMLPSPNTNGARIAPVKGRFLLNKDTVALDARQAGFRLTSERNKEENSGASSNPLLPTGTFESERE